MKKDVANAVLTGIIFEIVFMKLVINLDEFLLLLLNFNFAEV